jgi:DNA polymerase-4
MPLYQARQLCPGLATVAPDHRFYEEKSSEVMALLARYSPVVEQNSIDEAWLDMTGTDRLFGSPCQCAERIMADIRENLGLWCSIGIAPNKFLAKMASEMKKPLGITEIGQHDIAAKLWPPLPIRADVLVGRKDGGKTKQTWMETVGDLARLEPAFLRGLFGRAGEELDAHANGLDDTPVQPHCRTK